MKKLLSLLTLGTVVLALPASSFAAPKKEKTAATPAPGATTPAPADAKAPEAKPMDGKKIPMYVRVDAIDEAAKTFTHKNVKGSEVKFVITDKTEIKQGTAEAKFSDIKVGDTVSGSRIEKSKTEYEVVKITKFGVVEPKRGVARTTPEPKKP